MSVGRDTIREALLATVGVVVFIAFLVAAGSISPDGIDTTGAYVIVGGIVAFILTMALIGVFFIGDD
ncbi:putative membrane protein [Halanaeroarchaeum sp. HSR-CO]|uniref:DUF7472 family protein n=1 Tax=Halanaeroarchaeum sp. HSR-CO TaxID=2866382 RepID=UPI00217CFC97|nr:hypothetical protein [Halanaeroarchaeum sp. HSR-CO]UWG48996.1 putative membrane protein [Halanaeroarchaeum sp. HSR-CO]